MQNGLATLDTPLGALRGRAGAGLIPGAPATLFIRPEALKLAAPGATADLTAEVGAAAFEGNFTHVALRAANGQALTMSLGRDGEADALAPGARIGLDVRERRRAGACRLGERVRR